MAFFFLNLKVRGFVQHIWEPREHDGVDGDCVQHHHHHRWPHTRDNAYWKHQGQLLINTN